MRISDWSSDVCSSDLSILGGLLPDRGLSARTIWVHPNVTIGSDIYDMSQKGGSVTNVTVRGQSHPNVTDLPMTRVGRSEEHTSELQSLMRISYAVFCLKKKKIKQ